MAHDTEVASSPSLASPDRLGGSRRQLESVLDRARDERLRMARLVKSYEGRLAQASVPATAETVARLTDQIETLGRAVEERFARLEDAELDIARREARLKELEHSAAEATRALADEVRRAQGFKDHIDAAKQHVRLSAGAVVEDVKAALSGFEGPIAEQLERLQKIETSVEDRVQSVERLIEDRVTGLLSRAGADAESALAPVQDRLKKFALAQAKALGDEARQHRDALNATALKKVSELDFDVEESIRPIAERFTQEVTDATEAVDGLVAELREQITLAAEQQAETVRERMERAVEAAVQQAVAERIGPYQQDAEAAAEAAVESAMARLRDAQAEPVAKAEAEARRLIDSASRAREQAGKAVAQLRQQAETVRHGVTEAVDAATQQIAGKADHLHEALGAAVVSAQQKVDQAVEGLSAKLTRRGQEIEDGLTQSLSDRVATLTLKAEQAAARCAEQSRLAQDVAAKTAELVGAARERHEASSEEFSTKWRQQLDSLDAAIQQGRDAWERESEAVAQGARKQLARIGEQARRLTDDAIDQCRHHLESSLAEFPTMAEQAAQQAQAQVDRWTAEAARRMDRTADKLRGDLSGSVVTAMGKAEAILERFDGQLEERLKLARAEAGEKQARGEALLREAQAELELAGEKIKAGLREASVAAMGRADELLARYRAQLEAQLQEARADADRAVDASLQNVEARFTGAVSDGKSAVDHALGEAASRVSELEDRSRQAADQAQQVTQRVDRLRGQVESDAAALAGVVEESAAEAIARGRAQLREAIEQIGLEASSSAEEAAATVGDRASGVIQALQAKWESSAERVREAAGQVDAEIASRIQEVTQRLEALGEEAQRATASSAGVAEKVQAATTESLRHMHDAVAGAEADARKTVESVVADLAGHVAFEAETVRSRSAAELEAVVEASIQRLDEATTPVVERLDRAAQDVQQRVAEAADNAEASARDRADRASQAVAAIVDTAEREAERRVRAMRARAALAIDDARQNIEASLPAKADTQADAETEGGPQMDRESIRQSTQALGQRVRDGQRKSAA
ncbi:MAG: hypothetical protein AAGA57_03685 [Planctomycetota bacterium]